MQARVRSFPAKYLACEQSNEDVHRLQHTYLEQTLFRTIQAANHQRRLNQDQIKGSTTEEIALKQFSQDTPFQETLKEDTLDAVPV